LTKKSKILLGRGSPRAYIPDVEANDLKLPCDRLRPMYYPEYFAYKIMRNFFLRNDSYTHLVLATDDIVVKAQNILQLLRTLDRYDFPVLSGLMHVDSLIDHDRYISLLAVPAEDKVQRGSPVWREPFKHTISVKANLFNYIPPNSH